MSNLNDVDIVILAGGLGTRVKPVLGDVPKLLAPINDRTYLDYLLDWLAGFGARRVILSLGHLADAIEAHLVSDARDDLEIVTVVENEPLGTAGALRHVRHEVLADDALIMNGDSYIGADLAAFVSAHRESGAAMTLMCVEVTESGRYGRVDVDENGRISAFREKEPDAGPGLISAGVYVFSSAGWDLLENADGPSVERDVFQKQPAGTLAAYNAGNVPFIDIGTPETLAEAASVIGAALSNKGDV